MIARRRWLNNEPTDDGLSVSQRYHLGLIQQVRTLDFNGKQIVESLLENRHWWRAVIMTRDKGYAQFRGLCDLINGNSWKGDLLLFIPAAGHEDELVELMERFGTESVRWKDEKEVMDDLGVEACDERILECWWLGLVD
jgi:hypothetical protein